MKRLSLCLLFVWAISCNPALAADAPAGDPRLVLRTNLGNVVIALFPEAAPKHVAQIRRLVELGAYDSTYFVRIEPGFVAQLGSVRNRLVPLTGAQLAAITKIPAELSPLPHRRGMVSMSRDPGDPDSAESSFGILLGPAPHLDGKFTIVGEVESGQAVLARMAAQPRDERDAPRSEIVVERAMLVSPARLLEMRWAGELGDGADAGAARDGRAPTRMVVGLLVMMGLFLLVYILAARLQPRRVAALGLLGLLVGAFFVTAELIARANRNEVIAVALFVGMLLLFKLMTRFEGNPRR